MFHDALFLCVSSFLKPAEGRQNLSYARDRGMSISSIPVNFHVPRRRGTSNDTKYEARMIT